MKVPKKPIPIPLMEVRDAKIIPRTIMPSRQNASSKRERDSLKCAYRKKGYLVSK